MIPIVPDSYLEVLEAPVPCLLGLNRSADKAKKLDPSIFTQEILLVLLDNNELIRHHTKPFTFSRLSNLKENIQKNYNTFSKEQLLDNYFITEEMKKRVEGICKTIEVSISNTILRYIPVVLPFNSNGQVDLREIKKVIEGQVKPVDEVFTHAFLETQMFMQYLDHLSKKQHSISRSNHYIAYSYH